MKAIGTPDVARDSKLEIKGHSLGIGVNVIDEVVLEIYAPTFAWMNEGSRCSRVAFQPQITAPQSPDDADAPGPFSSSNPS